MRISYYPETDTLYIELNEGHGTATRQCANDVAVDVGPNNEPIGIEIEYASKKTDLTRLKTDGLKSMRIVHEPLTYTSNWLSHDLLEGTNLLEGASPFGTDFRVDLGGNGGSVAVVRDVLDRETREGIQELLR